jgi:hypothetical protein
MPSKAKHYDVCQEQTLENYNTLFNNNITSNLSEKFDENIIETSVKLCTCSKRKLSDNHFHAVKFNVSNHNKLLEELHLSNLSLESMCNDGLVYIHDLVLVFLKYVSQFDQILCNRYHLSKKQANRFVKIMNKWWEKHQAEFININDNVIS